MNKYKFYRSNAFLRSPKWLSLRHRVLNYYGRKCLKCGTTKNVIQVDHIKPRVTHPHLALNFLNCQPLCKPCNKKKGWKSTKDYRPLWKVFRYWFFH